MTVMDRLFAGKVLKEITLGEKSYFGLGKQKISILVTLRRGKIGLKLKNSSRMLLGASVNYTNIAFENLESITRGFAEIYQINKSHNLPNQPQDKIIELFRSNPAISD